MSLLLHIETSTEVCSVCLSDQEEVLSIREEDKGLRHAEKLTIFIRECLEEAGQSIDQLSGVVLSKGPGSYTGLRVGSSVAKGICYGQQIPLIVVDTLEALALAAIAQFPEIDICIPMIDARRMEVYSAIFDRSGRQLRSVQAEILEAHSYESYVGEGHQIGLLGNGSEKAMQLLVHPAFRNLPIRCSSSHLVSLGWADFQSERYEDVAYFEPLYLKPPNITQSKKTLL